MNDIANIVASVGFPIVAVCGCAWFVKYMYDTFSLKFDKLSEVINNNTLAITKLIEQFSDRKED